MDMLSVIMSKLKRSSSIFAVASDGSYSVELPVSLLLERVSPPSVEMVLREKGMKLYRLEGELHALSFMLQMGVKGMGTGEYSVAPEEYVKYVPVKQINVQWKVGWSIWRDDGTTVEEVLPCALRM
jgi:hypothetical protein